jgi:hypothetical protein
MSERRGMLFEDEFEEIADRARAAKGGNPLMPTDAWRALSEGRTVGNTVDLAAGTTQFAATADVFQIQSSESNALQLGITIAPPQISVGPVNTAQFTGNVPFGFIAQMAPAPLSGVAVAFPLSQAIIDWGMGGSRCTAFVDINNGCSLNLMASQFVRVRVQLISAPIPASTVRYSAFVGPGVPRAGARKTFYITSNVGVETTAFAIPPFADRVTLSGADAAGTVFVGTLRFYRGKAAGGNGSNLLGEYLFSQNVSNQLPVRVPEGAMFWAAVPQSANDIMPVVFDLAI